jgi:hypothetical protein
MARALRKCRELVVLVLWYVAACHDVESLSGGASTALCARKKPAHARLRLRGGLPSDEELAYPGPFGPVSEAIAVATTLRRPLKISPGVHSWCKVQKCPYSFTRRRGKFKLPDADE